MVKISMKDKFRPIKRPKQKRSLETFNAILESSLIILKENGLSAFNTNSVADKAGVSISSLYQYFPNKESILGELIIDFVKEQDEQVLSKLKDLTSDSSFTESLYCIISSLVDFNDANKDMCSIIYANIPVLGKDKEVLEIENTTLSILKDILIKYKKDLRDQNIDILLKLIYQSILGVYASIHTKKNVPTNDREILKKELTYLAFRYLT